MEPFIQQNEAIVGREFPKKVIPLIDQAKNSIEIMVFDWRWYPYDPGASCQLFNQSIIRASRRGVKVRVIANNDEIVKILKQEKIEAKRLLTEKLVHAKMMIIDDETAITGSHNYTQSAFTMNLELSMILRGREEIKRLKQFFDNLYG